MHCLLNFEKKNRRKQITKRFVPSGDVVTMTAADSVVSCRRRKPLFESILGRFLSLNHRAMHADQLQVRVRVMWIGSLTTWLAPRKGSARAVAART
jgi:hypothetical protein